MRGKERAQLLRVGLSSLGSGLLARIMSLKVLGFAAPNTGVLSIVICCRRPSDRRNSSAIPRAFFVASATFGLPPATENLATTGMWEPENSSERLSAGASEFATNSPIAQVPLV